MLRGIEELEAELDAGGNAGNTGFFAMHCKNFATPAKFCYAQFFAIIAKIRYHSECYCA